MLAAVLPGAMLLVRIKTPSENEFGTILVRPLLRADSLPDQPRKIPIRLIAGLVRCLRMSGIRLNAGQRRATPALRRLAGALLQRSARHLRIDFRHGVPHRGEDGPANVGATIRPVIQEGSSD